MDVIIYSVSMLGLKLNYVSKNGHRSFSSENMK